jgi:hypothetical protein
MAWVYAIKNGREMEGQAIPPAENVYDFVDRFVRRRGAIGDSELYVLDEGAGRSSPMTVEEVTVLKYLWGSQNATRT